MIKIQYDQRGRVSGCPDSIRPDDNLTFEIVAKDAEVSENDTLRLVLSLPEPIHIETGEWTVTWGGDTTPLLVAADLDAFQLEIALNRLDSIVAAGGVECYDDHGRIVVNFLTNGSRDGFSLYHSILGSVAGRTRTIVAGNANHRATFEVDFTLQVLAEATSGTDITAASVSVANVATGDASTAQRDTITISRLPDYGKFQIWTAADISTRWLESSASAYQVLAALEDVEPGEFLVTRHVTGDEVLFDLRRTAVGVNAAPTVANTFMGPVGVTMNLDGSKILELTSAMKLEYPPRGVLTFIRDGEMQFSQTVNLAPVIMEHGQPI